MPDIILPSKLVTERITATFDFSDELAWAEVIVSATTTIVAVSGVDASADVMRYRAPAISNSIVTQQVYKGLPGVIYKITCTIEGGTGATYAKSANLAVLPDNARTPFMIGVLFTSRPYPIEAIDSYDAALTTIRARLTGIAQQDSFRSGLTLVSGKITGGAVFYTQPPEAIISSLDIISGNLYGDAVFNTAAPESIISALTIVSGNLWGSAVAHEQPADAYISGLTIVSGDLA